MMINSVAVFGKSATEENLVCIKKIVSFFVSRKVRLYCESEFLKLLENAGCKELDGMCPVNRDSASCPIDLVLSIGGDGTFLDSAAFVGERGIPILGINSGRMGFLANVAVDTLDAALNEVMDGNYSISERKVLRFKLEGWDEMFALNEVSIHKSELASLLKIHVKIDGQYVTTYWSDGLIISTPTGSTAYSMSAGGPIVNPECGIILLTPVCPHNLSLRPMVIPSKSIIDISVESRSGNYVLSADSKITVCKDLQKFSISEGGSKIRILQIDGMNFYDTLRKKLHWGDDYRNAKL